MCFITLKILKCHFSIIFSMSQNYRSELSERERKLSELAEYIRSHHWSNNLHVYLDYLSRFFNNRYCWIKDTIPLYNSLINVLQDIIKHSEDDSNNREEYERILRRAIKRRDDLESYDSYLINKMYDIYFPLKDLKGSSLFKSDNSRETNALIDKMNERLEYTATIEIDRLMRNEKCFNGNFIDVLTKEHIQLCLEILPDFRKKLKRILAKKQPAAKSNENEEKEDSSPDIATHFNVLDDDTIGSLYRRTALENILFRD